MSVLLGIDDDPRFEDVLGCLRWCVRIGPSDQVIILHATPVVPWMPHAAGSHADRPSGRRQGRAGFVLTNRRVSETGCRPTAPNPL